jgi:hypothetical protein
MKYIVFLFFMALLSMGLMALFAVKCNKLENELSTLKSQRSVERITLIDSIKSAEFIAYETEFKFRDSIYNVQLTLLQNENTRLKTNYNRLYRSYSDIAIDRPRF